MRYFLAFALLFSAAVAAQDEHSHPAPEKLGTVSFQISCNPQVQLPFNRAVALLHSFSYQVAEEAFQHVAEQDPQCAIAHWGIAMTHYHQLWDPPLPAGEIAAAEKEIEEAAKLSEASPRERGFIHALSLVFEDAATVPYSTRASNYEAAMRSLAAANPKDVESQVFYALALIASASPLDKEHRKQKQALDILEPLWREFPNHPGIPHYLIHACDSQELAPRGLAAARAYARIAPSAPHALHMPSHIFTRLGLWNDSVASNLAAKAAAQQQGDTGEELHAMDYLVYAYLQNGQNQQADQVIQQLKAMHNPALRDFKSGYAATAMQIRYIVENREWDEAAKFPTPPDTVPQVQAVAAWARGIGLAHQGNSQQAQKESEALGVIEGQLRAAGNSYWETQVNIMKREVIAWSTEADKKPDEAVAILSSAADDEDRVEKLPMTPGPIIPAREQLGELFLLHGDSKSAAKAFQTDLVNSPGRRGAKLGALRAAKSN